MCTPPPDSTRPVHLFPYTPLFRSGQLLTALPGQVVIGELLVLDALLHVLVVAVELLDAVVGAERGVVVGDDGRQRRLLAFWVLPVVGLFLRQVFLQLLHIGADIGRRGEHRSDIAGPVVRVGLPFLGQFCGSEERGGGKEWVSACEFGWMGANSKK